MLDENEKIVHENITEIDSEVHISQSYSNYGAYVLDGRALPSIIDGLKNVERRILWVMLNYPNGKIEKSSAIEGDALKYHPHGGCIVGSTKFYTLSGEYTTIEDLYNKGEFNVEVLSYNISTGNVEPGLVTDIWITKYVDELYEVELSNGYKFRLTGDHQVLVEGKGFVNTETLISGDKMITSSIYKDFNHRPIVKVHNGVNDNNYREYIQRLVNFYTRDYVPSYHIHHVNKNVNDNRLTNLDYISSSEHSRIHGPDGLEGLEKGRQSMKTSLKEANKDKNSKLMKEFNSNQGLHKAVKIVEMILSDGKEVNEENYEEYRLKLYNGTTLSKVLGKGYSLSDLIDRAFKSKVVNYERDSELWNDDCSIDEEKGPRSRNRKFRTSYEDVVLEVKSVSLIRLNEKVPVYDFSESNNHNALFYSGTTISDKGSQDELVCLHNCYGSLVKMANTDPSFIKTQGNFGGRDFGASAHRYTSAGLSKFAYLNYKFYKSSIMQDGELDGYTEPKFLPGLLPYGFLDGSEGMGSGIATSLPKLDPLDMIDSIKEYIQTKNITNYPKIDLGEVDVTTNINHVKDISKVGKGLVRFRGKVTILNDREVKLHYRPDRIREDALIQLANKLGVEFTNLGEYYLYTIPKRSRVKVEELKEQIIKTTTSRKSYNISLYNDGVAYITNYKNSVKELVDYLKQAITRSIKSEYDRSEKQLKVLRAIRSISQDEYLMNNLHKLDVSEILDYCKSNHPDYEEYYYKEALSKPIRSLSKDHSADISKLEKLLDELLSNMKSENILKYMIDLYDELKDHLINELKYENRTIYLEVCDPQEVADE